MKEFFSDVVPWQFLFFNAPVHDVKQRLDVILKSNLLVFNLTIWGKVNIAVYVLFIDQNFLQLQLLYIAEVY